jgi:hypothetical protein
LTFSLWATKSSSSWAYFLLSPAVSILHLVENHRPTIRPGIIRKFQCIESKKRASPEAVFAESAVGGREFEAQGSGAVGLGENDVSPMVPEGKARAGVPGGKNRKTLPGNLQILEAFQPQMPAIRVFDHDVVGGLNHEMHWDTQGVIPPT